MVIDVQNALLSKGGLLDLGGWQDFSKGQNLLNLGKGNSTQHGQKGAGVCDLNETKT